MLQNAMTHIRDLFRKNDGYPLQIYGKRPFYKDYIAVVTTKGGIRFRDWLLSTFGGEGIAPPPGLNPFVFRGGPGRELVAGLLEPSSDGLRKFPFSIFADLNLARAEKARQWSLLLYLFGELGGVHELVRGAESIDACYSRLPARIGNGAPPPPAGDAATNVSLLEALDERDGDPWPHIWGLSPTGSRLVLLGDGNTSPKALMDRWKVL